VLENLLLRHQVAVLTRPTRSRRRARLCTWDKLLWVLARRFCTNWREHLSFVTPDTIVRWHRPGWCLFWRWKFRSRGGRPHLSPEMRELIATMSRENRLWGTERIRGELLKLGIVVSNRSIRRYRSLCTPLGEHRASHPEQPSLGANSAARLARPCAKLYFSSRPRQSGYIPADSAAGRRRQPGDERVDFGDTLIW
jgi:hypothetical protein